MKNQRGKEIFYLYISLIFHNNKVEYLQNIDNFDEVEALSEKTCHEI